ncbi:MAG TPA: carbohydrate ABC transporter permease [Streptosporangiaceae bacterium]|nr:carbohydrate ABC transporter permease [Streptosporangiaceae bacterium]
MAALSTSLRAARRQRRQARAQGAVPARGLVSTAQLNRGSNRIIYRIVLTVVIVIATLVFIGPLYFLFSDGLKSTQEAIASPPTLYPHQVHFSTYTKAWSFMQVGILLKNTLYYAIGALLFQLVFDVSAAYALSKLRPVLGNVIFAMMLSTLMIPAAVLLVPQYLTVASLPIVNFSLLGTPEAIWLPSVANAFSIFLLKRFFDSIPGDLLAAAAIDGASPLRTLWKIVIPISRPILGVVSIFSFIGVWKDFLWPLLVEANFTPTRESLNVGIYELSGSAPQNLVIAASAMAAIPTLIFFLFFQRNIMSGLTAGGLRG